MTTSPLWYDRISEKESRIASWEQYRGAFLMPKEVKRCRRNRCDHAPTLAAPTSVTDSSVSSTARRNAANMINTSAVPMSTASTAEHGSVSVTEHPLCEMCLKEGRLTPVQEVHHILPVSKGGTHARENLMSLCQSCHTKIHHDLGDR